MQWMTARSTRWPILASLQALLLLGFPFCGSAEVHTIDGVSAWATWVEELNVGPRDSAQPELGMTNWGVPGDAIGAAQGNGSGLLSLGEGGTITVGFEPTFGDGPGDDLAVFENGFWTLGGLFGELAFVEVSSNGVDFARFNSLCLQTSSVPTYGVLDPASYANFAGLEESGVGVGFDLSELEEHPLVEAERLDLQAIGYVRLVDVIGDGSILDAFGNSIYDPYPTRFASSGFDLDGVGVIQMPEASRALLSATGLAGLAWLARRRRQRWASRAVGLGCVLAFGQTAEASYTVTFEDLSLPAGGYYDGSDEIGYYESEFVEFENGYDPQWGSWWGFGASNHVDNTTPGWSNQWSAIPGGGQAGSETYGIYFYDPWASLQPRLILPDLEIVEGMFVTNTTYAFLSMRDGDGFAKQFGAGDWFQLSVEGFDDLGNSVGQLDFYLADFLSATPGPDYILDQWTWIDLSSLGPIRALGFSLSSSDNGEWGMNTPAYFALDDIRVVPEPDASILLFVGLALLSRLKQR